MIIQGIPGRNRDKQISNNTLLFALCRLGYKGKMTGHGFRAVAPTILNEQGYDPDVIKRQLAHFERDEVQQQVSDHEADLRHPQSRLRH